MASTTIARSAGAGAVPVLRLRPDRGRLVVALVQGVAGVVVPVYLTAALVMLVPAARPRLLVPLVVIVALLALVIVRLRRTRIEARPDAIVLRRALPGDVVVPTSEVASVVSLRVLEPRGTAAHRRLYLQDAERRTRLRMGEELWGADQVDAFIARLGVPVQVVEEPLSIAELRQQRQVRLEWWERGPLVAGIALAVVLVTVSLALLVPILT